METLFLFNSPSSPNIAELTNMQADGLFRSTIRSFLKAFGFILGLALALIIVGLIAASGSQSRPSPLSHIQPKTLPKGDGKLLNPSETKQTLLWIPIQGFIGDKKMDKQEVEFQMISALNFCKDRSQIKAIILSINSGGGFAVTSQQIYSVIQQYSKLIDCPVYTFVDGISASGAYLISCASSKIYATDYSIVGSVGSKFADFFNFSTLMDNHGIKAKNLYAGKNKDPLNMFVPWEKDSDQELQAILDRDYEIFVNLVAKNRPLTSKEDLINKYGAGVFSAEESLSFGLIDETFTSTYEMLKTLSQELNLNEDYQILNFSHTSVLESIIESTAKLPSRALQNFNPQHPTLFQYTP